MPIRQFSFQTCVLKILIDKGSWKESYLKACREKELVFSLAQKYQLLTDLAKKRNTHERSEWRAEVVENCLDWPNPSMMNPEEMCVPKKIDEERRYNVTK